MLFSSKMIKTNNKIASLKSYNRTAEAVIISPFLITFMPFDLENAVGAFQKGNIHVFEDIYQALSPKMFGVCLRYASSKEEAKDILQDSFIKIYHQLKTFRGDGSFEGWARRIVVNTALEYFRTNTKWQNVPLNDAEQVFEIENDEDILSDLSFQEMLLLVQELPPTYRMVFNLYAFEGMKHREIAQELGISEGTSKSNLSDARRILQRKLSSILK
jgi:RNA polymerase sigma-70 factor, ECF subfamily